jgi:hypothetical protein
MPRVDVLQLVPLLDCCYGCCYVCCAGGAAGVGLWSNDQVAAQLATVVQDHQPNIFTKEHVQYD